MLAKTTVKLQRAPLLVGYLDGLQHPTPCLAVQGLQKHHISSFLECAVEQGSGGGGVETNMACHEPAQEVSISSRSAC